LIVFDTESDGLMHEKVEILKDGTKIVHPPATKFHIFGWTTDGKQVSTTDDPSVFLGELSKHEYAACHNASTHDFPLLERLLGYQHKGTKVDTLLLSWERWPNRPKHSLESFEQESGIQKVQVSQDQWAEGDYELMKQRVTNDVLLNWWVAQRQFKLLEKLYT